METDEENALDKEGRVLEVIGDGVLVVNEVAEAHSPSENLSVFINYFIWLVPTYFK